MMISSPYQHFLQPIPQDSYDPFLGNLYRAVFKSKNKKGQEAAELNLKKKKVTLAVQQVEATRYQIEQEAAKTIQEQHKANREARNAEKALAQAQTAVADMQRANAGKFLAYFWIAGGFVVVGSLVYLVAHLTGQGEKAILQPPLASSPELNLAQ